jgi:hydroxymethylpyrimidine/phosphomethylpyrimidine kinase
MHNTPKGRVLIVAGSDSGGGAGIQGDIKTVTALGGYAATAITALTAQNTRGVFGIHEVPDDFIARQMRLVLEDIGADAVKTGMLHKASVIHTVADVLEDYPSLPLILDPVMAAKGGAPLLQEDAVAALVQRLIPRAFLLTPNVPEAEMLAESAGCKLRVASCRDMEEAGKILLSLGTGAVLMKGGHLAGGEVADILMSACNPQPATCHSFTSPRIHTRHTHGTGCTLASAIATGIAQGMTLYDAVGRARQYTLQAIKTAPGFGQGHGPLNHGHSLKYTPCT